jgi:phosphoribosylanthranilate isomerase
MGYRIRTKICGVTTAADAAMVVSAGADLIGLNFYPKSPRYIDQSAAQEILSTIPATVEPVGVFAGEVPKRMVAHAQRFGRSLTIQAHGGWPLPAEVTPYELILAVPIGDLAGLEELADYLKRSSFSGKDLAGVLIDARVVGQFGGTGKTVPWALLSGFRPRAPLILAGGLTPENVAEAIRIVRPDAVDVASGVESSPGRKDAGRVRSFIENARQAAATLPD